LHTEHSSPPTAGRLICFGDLCVDIVAQTPEFDPHASDVTIDKLAVRVAGAGANSALAASAAGASVEMIGLLGNDAFATVILEKLRAARVGTSLVRRAEERTGMAISLVREDGERALLSYRGANAQKYGALPGSLFKPADYLYLSGYTLQDSASAETAYMLRARAAQAGARCALDPTYLLARNFQKKHLSGIHILTPNLEEARLMSGRTSPEECAKELHDLGAEVVIVTLGPQGCYIQSGDCRQFVLSETTMAAANTTGAGDIFCGTLLARSLQGFDIVKAAQSANEAAGRAVCN
jgi:sugar/nucleoside kinase (ribokinase family)